MKATGIVRRIDDLGRVVIPKEIRRTMHIREGDPPLITLTVKTLSARLADFWVIKISLLSHLKFTALPMVLSAKSSSTSDLSLTFR